MSPEEYDAWYRTPRGAWIGDAEIRLLIHLLEPQHGETLLDVGCGTGHFTRRFARGARLQVTGVDPNPQWLAYARDLAQPGERFVEGRAEQLPFADRSFDCTASVTALCFIAEQRHALREILRVTRRRVVLGLLNQRCLLSLREGRDGGVGGYCGAHWHTASQVRALFAALPARSRAQMCRPPAGWRQAGAADRAGVALVAARRRFPGGCSGRSLSATTRGHGEVAIRHPWRAE